MGKLFNFTKKDKPKDSVKITIGDLYNYSDKESRKKTIEFLYANAKNRRQRYDEYCREMKRYYDGEHDTTPQMAGFVQEQGLPWAPTQCTDGFIHVETQIDTNIPEFEFTGRDDDLDSTKAKIREYLVKYVFENNPMAVMNTKNERRKNLYGAAVWKVSYDKNKKMGQFDGNIVVSNPKIQNIFWDTTAEENIDDCEFFPMVYRMHKMRVAREFRDELKAIGKTINDFSVGYGYSDTEFLKQEVDSYTYEGTDETLQITEWAFRQPDDGQMNIEGVDFKWKAGDIGIVTLINGEEVKYNPKYWRKTGCDMYPFSVYCEVPNDDNIIGKSSIEMIKDYIDATDRALGYAQLNDAFYACDTTLLEEGALADNCELNNVPGGTTVVKQGKMGSVAHIPNSATGNYALYDSADKFEKRMQDTNGNSDAFQGNLSNSPRTATEIAIARDQSNSRQDLKKPDTTAGWERLVRLIDYTALEAFDDDRTLFLGAPKEEGDPVVVPYNSDNLRILNESTKEYYYPVIDATIHMGDGLQNSKAFTISAVKELAMMTITMQNYEFIKAYIDETNIPQKVELKEFIDEFIGEQKAIIEEQKKKEIQAQEQATQEQPQISMQEIMSKLNPEELKAVESNPEIMQQAVEQNGVALAE